MTAPLRLDADYELTVVGELGPVLQAMVRATATASSELLTIICLRTHGDEDLVDILRPLSCQGLEIRAISAFR